jgi:hypothetical protein
MAESALAAIQRQQIEIAVGELLLTSDYYMRTSIAERITCYRHKKRSVFFNILLPTFSVKYLYRNITNRE